MNTDCKGRHTIINPKAGVFMFLPKNIQSVKSRYRPVLFFIKTQKHQIRLDIFNGGCIIDLAFLTQLFT